MRGWAHRLLAGRQGRLVGPVLALATGALIAQAAAYAARPVLTRLFDPEAFGYLSFYLAAAGTLSEAATGRFEAAAMLPERNDEARGLLRIAALLALSLSAVLFALTPFRGPLAAALGRPELATLVPLIAAGTLGAALTRVAEAWLVRKERFRSVSAGRVAQSAIAAPLQVAAGLLGTGPIGLVGGAVAGRVVAMAGVVMAALRTPPGDAGTAPIPPLRALAARYRRFPLLSMPAAVLNTLSSQLPALVLLAAFSPAVAGYFGIAYGTVAIPMQLVGSSVAQVFFVRAAEARREGRLGRLVRRVASRLVLIGLFPLAALIIIGPEAFAFVFGANWREAGVYAQMLAPWLFLVFVGSPISSLFDVLERQGAELTANVVVGAGRLAALAAGGAAGGARGAIFAFGAVSALGWAVQTTWLLRRAGAGGALGRALTRPAALAAGPITALAAAKLAGLDGLPLAGVLIAASVLYAALAARFGSEGADD